MTQARGDPPEPASGTADTPYQPAVPIERLLDRFWRTGPEFDRIRLERPPDVAEPPSILEQLGPSPFERGGFPVVGFLATTLDRVSRYARERAR